jgi:hypothetical protein
MDQPARTVRPQQRRAPAQGPRLYITHYAGACARARPALAQGPRLYITQIRHGKEV